MMCYVYRGGPKPVPINRIIDVTKHMDLIANSVIYTPARARQLVAKYLEEAGGCGCGLRCSFALSPGVGWSSSGRGGRRTEGFPRCATVLVSADR